MNNKIIGIFIVTLLIITVLPVVVSTEKNSYTKENFESIIFSEPIIQEKEEQYVAVSVEEATSCLMKPGEPILPVVTKVYTFPFGTKIKEIVCRPSGIQEKNVFKEIIPCPEPVTCSSVETAIAKTVKNREVYSSTNLYPDSWYSYRTGSGLDGDEHVVFLTIGVYPVRYSPKRSVLQYIDRVEITVVYEEPLQPLLMNNGYDTAIIAPEKFTDELQPLVDYKNDCGISTKLVILDDIYDGTCFGVTSGRDNQEKIKNFIYQAVEQWGIEYVLLVGDESILPGRYSYCYDGVEENFLSDLYYADIYDSNGGFCSWDADNDNLFGEKKSGEDDEVDLYPDVYLGRYCCRDEDEVVNIVNKNIQYSSKNSPKTDWFHKIITCGGDTHKDNDKICEGERLNQYVIDMLPDFIPVKIWATIGNLQSIYDLNYAMGEGAGFLYLAGHGSSYSWSTHPKGDFETWIPQPGYTTLQAGRHNNGEKLPIVIISACSVCKFSTDNCFGWSYLDNTNGGGIATFGTTGLGWSYIGKWYGSGLNGGMTLSMFRSYALLNSQTLGELWSNAISDYIDNYGLSKSKDFKTIEQYAAFCDPSMIIREINSEIPNKPDIPSGPVNGRTGDDYNYSIQPVDPDGDKIKCCFDWGEGNQTWTDWVNSGETVTATHNWSEGSFEIKVKTRDENGLESEWSDPLPITMPKNKAINPFLLFLERLIERFPILEQILQPIYDKLA